MDAITVPVLTRFKIGTRAMRAYHPRVAAWLIFVMALVAVPLSWSFPSLARWPVALAVPLDQLINAFFGFLTTPIIGGISAQSISRACVPLLSAPVILIETILQSGVSRGYGDHAVEMLPPLSWLGVSLAVCAMSYRARGYGLAILAGITCTYLLLFGLWGSMMVTLSQMIVAVPLGVALGFAGGVYLYRHPNRRPAVLLLLDQAQTIPIFSYLVPIIIFFGIGAAPAIIAIVIF